MANLIKILLVVENLPDTKLIRQLLKSENIEFVDIVLDNEIDFQKALGDFQPDIVISDFSKSLFDGNSTLEITRSFSKTLPFIILTNSQNEEEALEYLRKGADDCVFKEHIKFLPQVVKKALEASQCKKEKEQIQKKLIEKEKLFSNIITPIQDIVFTLDCQQRHTGIYGSWLKNWGLTEEFFLGKTARDIFGRENSIVHEKANQKALKGEFVVYEWSAQLNKKDFYFQTSLSPIFDEKGLVVGLVGIGRDITELKMIYKALQDTELRLKVALKDSPVTVWNQDKYLRYTWMYNSNFGFTDEEAIGKRDEDLFSADDAIVLTKVKRKVLTHGITSTNEVKINIGGEPFFFQLVTEPLKDADGNIVGITYASINITQIKNYQNRLQKIIDGLLRQ